MVLIQVIFYFFAWTFLLYWIHRLVHKIKILNKYHFHHHRFINSNSTSWHVNNLVLFNDDFKSTVDLWITEVIPTVIFSFITGQWWILGFYYVWASIFQENLEHRKNLNLPLLTCGKWHLIHHKAVDKNFGLFFPIWDIVFKTNRKTNWIRG